MRHLLARARLSDRVHVESAGTGDWHVGEPADRRSVAHAKRRGIVLDRRATLYGAELGVLPSAESAAAWTTRIFPDPIKQPYHEIETVSRWLA